ncbi:outer membrane beta-barrel protein [Methylobacterium sp. PvR107]|uniref:outer membrane beta-barrel protein n=1 Tax=Methylobacterium sp. PvR107 TaxID=2806597 RepID=UPI001B79D1E9|nr:outer membrane beta-barrel protein [Methylobacterium sp. PvR107]MBP1178329.1 opacity protein-like surface antigen [Methylobacterium sp. PvR107]
MMHRIVSTGLVMGLLSSTALSADLAHRRASEPVAPPVFTWSGVYGGLFAGFGALDSATQFLCTGPDGRAGAAGCPVLPSRRGTDDGFIAGGEVGGNWEVGSGFVVGGAADYQFTRLWDYGEREGRFTDSGGRALIFNVAHAGQRLDQLATVRGKVGFALGPTLIYGTGGLAFGNVRIDSNLTTFNRSVFDAREGEVRTGYAVGAGLEHAFTDHLSAKVEGLYYDLGSRSVLAAPIGRVLPGYHAGARIATDGFLTRVGLNCRFGAGLPSDGPAAPSPWAFEGGLRYFYSSGGPRYTLGDPFKPGQINSRLTYAGSDAHSGESFARVEHVPTGLFAKGFLGAGGVTSGRLSDEDFPPAESPYSKTLSPIKDGDISYGVIDFGYDVLRRDGFSLGGFVGYQYDAELLNGDGCRQVARNGICAGRSAVPDQVKVLGETLRWNALRVGLIGEARFDRVRLSLEGAYLPAVSLEGVDRHWLRPDINPLPQQGHGDGYFAEGIVSYDVTPRVSVGVGGRYWRMQTDSGSVKFPTYPRSPTKFETDRYGAFAQISYRLADFGLGEAGAPAALVGKD